MSNEINQEIQEVLVEVSQKYLMGAFIDTVKTNDQSFHLMFEHDYYHGAIMVSPSSMKVFVTCTMWDHDFKTSTGVECETQACYDDALHTVLNRWDSWHKNKVAMTVA